MVVIMYELQLSSSVSDVRWLGGGDRLFWRLGYASTGQGGVHLSGLLIGDSNFRQVARLGTCIRADQEGSAFNRGSTYPFKMGRIITLKTDAYSVDLIRILRAGRCCTAP